MKQTPYTQGYIPGDRRVECDICGFVYRYSQMRRGVQLYQAGLIVCPRDFDPIHPRDKLITPPIEEAARLVE